MAEPGQDELSVGALLATDLGPLRMSARGKVRDVYEVSEGRLLFVATDRISAFDHVLGSGIPDKGRILTQTSLFWFDYLRGLVPNHVVSADVAQYPPELEAFAGQIRGRSMLVRRLRMFPVECVARGYLSGSGWKDYQATGAICGVALPPGLCESDRLSEPIFTPAAKINTGGHDENIGFDAVVAEVGGETAENLRALTMRIYQAASAHAESKGLILSDTKFEFGVEDPRPEQAEKEQAEPEQSRTEQIREEQSRTARPQIVLGDEVLTPDSSRFWPAASWSPGGPQASFDKQYVRDYLERIGWNKQAPAPALPAEVIERTRGKYMEAFTLLTGRGALPE